MTGQPRGCLAYSNACTAATRKSVLSLVAAVPCLTKENFLGAQGSEEVEIKRN